MWLHSVLHQQELWRKKKSQSLCLITKYNVERFPLSHQQNGKKSVCELKNPFCKLHGNVLQPAYKNELHCDIVIVSLWVGTLSRIILEQASTKNDKEIKKSV